MFFTINRMDIKHVCFYFVVLRNLCIALNYLAIISVILVQIIMRITLLFSD